MSLNFTYQQLINIATRKEHALSRQLAKQEKLPPEQALFNLLERAAQNAGLQDIAELARQRDAAKMASAAQKLAKKAAKQDERKIQQFAIMPLNTWLAWFDGSAVPNPGKCQIACILKAPDGQSFEYIEHMEYGDSCDAEYSGLILVLQQARQHQIVNLLVHGDSQVIIDDFNQIKVSGLLRMQQYRQQAQQLSSVFEQLQVRWIPRHKNHMADTLTQIRSKESK
ncbi:reverse transcriptase-like protein [Undibacterium sp. Ji83W]|uniref:reverse transcriptase-like protein n=1 Tax=Undibacterium sp. Ji83W TaxID=3413043 RepID=UPI003BF3532A